LYWCGLRLNCVKMCAISGNILLLVVLHLICHVCLASESAFGSELSPIEILYPKTSFTSLNYFGIINSGAEVLISWKFHPRRFVRHEMYSKLQTCVEIVRVSVEERQDELIVKDELGLLMPLRCYKHDSTFMHSATQVIRLNGFLENNHYQLKFFLRDNGNTRNSAHLGGGRFDLHHTRVFSTKGIYPSRYPSVKVGDNNKNEIVFDYKQTKGNIQYMYSLLRDESFAVMSNQIEMKDVILEEEHLEVCFNLQVQDQEKKQKNIINTKTDKDEHEHENEADWETILNLCATPEQGSFGFMFNGIVATRNPYRVELWTKLSAKGYEERPWPASYRHIGKRGSLESQGIEEGEHYFSFLTIKSLEYELPYLKSPQPQILEWKSVNHVGKGVIPTKVIGKSLEMSKCMWCMRVYKIDGIDHEYSIGRTHGVEGDQEKIQTILDEALRLNITAMFGEGAKAIFNGSPPKYLVNLNPNPPLILTSCSPVLNDRGGINQFTLEGVPNGMYKLHIMLGGNLQNTQYGKSLSQEERSLHGGVNLLQRFDSTESTTMTELVLAVQEGEEVKPRYDWQEIRGWHTVPAGTETRLPISDLKMDANTTPDNVLQNVEYSVKRETRIPDPYQLQLRFPKPCKFFFRTSIYRSSLVGSIEEEANKLCSRHLPPGCLYIVNEKTSQRLSNSTAEQLDLFNTQLKLEVDVSRKDCKDILPSESISPSTESTKDSHDEKKKITAAALLQKKRDAAKRAEDMIAQMKKNGEL